MPPETKLQIRPARPDEARALTALALASKAVWGYSAALRAQFQNELTITPDYIAGHPVFVVERREADGGGQCAAVMAFGALDPITDCLVDLDLMFVAPAAMGRGIGRALFAHLCSTARARAFTGMKIVSDPHALRFYEHMGAVQIGNEESASVPGRRLPVLHHDLRGQI